MFLLAFCFFSSRRRHTRLQGDWSSDVCSSDLILRAGGWSCSGDHDGPDHLPDHRRNARSEEHTSALQSPRKLVCRLLLERKNQPTPPKHNTHPQPHPHPPHTTHTPP